MKELQAKAQNIALSAYKCKNEKALKASIILLAQNYAEAILKEKMESLLEEQKERFF
jgi:hypothetical protein